MLLAPVNLCELHNYYLVLSFLLMYSSSVLSTHVFHNKTNINTSICECIAYACRSSLYIEFRSYRYVALISNWLTLQLRTLEKILLSYGNDCLPIPQESKRHTIISKCEYRLCMIIRSYGNWESETISACVRVWLRMRTMALGVSESAWTTIYLCNRPGWLTHSFTDSLTHWCGQ